MTIERYAWSGRIKSGKLAEYKRRHDELWPDMKAVLNAAGIGNYTIFTDGERLFGYYECAKGAAYAARAQAESPVVARWNAYMADVLELDTDPVTGAQKRLQAVFRLD
ncbi:MAG: L-rhamnose mutarotase [Clostridiales bacterium]|jgi:L-rhamnose mutarotase|nr:L-rhamnose mutarotase [Clostridiales bacterium]